MAKNIVEMSKLRMTFSRLLALGGFTALSGSTFAYYRYNLLGDSPVVSTAECSPTTPQYYEDRTNSPPLEKKQWDDNWDLRKPKKLSKKAKVEIPLVDSVTENISILPVIVDEAKPTATRHVILVRHGQYVSHDDDKYRVLTDLGRQQATITGERLKTLGVNFDDMVVSTMTRAQETGNLIGDSLPELEKTHCSLLREGAPYPIEPKSSVWSPCDRKFFQDNPRIEGAFRKYIHRADPQQKEDSYQLLVCHANVIRYFVCRSLQFPAEGWCRMSVPNCGLTWLSIRPSGNVSLRGMGDIGHLPPNLITFN